MSPKHDGSGNGHQQAGFGRMSEERPLDSMLPGLVGSNRAKSEPVEAHALHPRVLEVELEAHWEWAMACWSDPGGVELEQQLTNLIRATLLAELSKPAEQVKSGRNFTQLRLLAFAELSGDSRQRIEALGFRPTEFEHDQYQERMSAWRDEAQAAGLRAGARPAEVYSLGIERPDPAIADKLELIQRQLIDTLAGEYWGETPGGPSRLMATYLRQRLNAQITPNREGVHGLELFLIQDKPHVLRWIPPMLFQALCDFGAVLLQAVYGLQVQWALCKPDAAGFVDPPVIRVKSQDGFKIVPLALRLIDWCVMPRGEESPSLAARLDQLADELS